jgi:hypothetical protein
MSTLWFVVPAHGRVELTAVCLRQLAGTCDDLAGYGIRASAVVVACDENLETARDLGFGAVERDNDFLGRRFNDGFQAACREGVDFAVPCGSDDWVDAAWAAAELPDDGEVLCSRELSMVSEDGQFLSRLRVGYEGGHGVRIIPRSLLERMGGRPAEEFRRRAIDASTLRRLRFAPATLRYREDEDPLAVVDWKSHGQQLNSFGSCARYAEDDMAVDPFDALEGRFDEDILDDMKAVYRLPVTTATTR